MGISPRLATGLVVSNCWDRRSCSRTWHTQDLLGLHDRRVGAQTCVHCVLSVCVDAVLNGLVGGVGGLHPLDSFNVGHVGSRCLRELLSASNCCPELGEEELERLRGVCGMEGVEKKKCLGNRL